MKRKRIIILLLAVLLLLGCSMGGTEKQCEATEQPADLPAETNEPEVKDPALNPFFTCTGTEYGAYPILQSEKREAEAKEFLSENRELLELAAVELLNKPDLKIYSGEAHMPNAEGWYEPIDAATLPESLQALVALSEKTGIDFYRTGPEPVFAEDAAPYFIVEFPRAIDTTYQDPGILYEVWLIYTANTAEQIRYFEMEPLAENWYIEVYFYAY